MTDVKPEKIKKIETGKSGDGIEFIASGIPKYLQPQEFYLNQIYERQSRSTQKT